MKNKKTHMFKAGIGLIAFLVVAIPSSTVFVNTGSSVSPIIGVLHDAHTVEMAIELYGAAKDVMLKEVWLIEGGTECPHVFRPGGYLCTWAHDGSGGIWIIWSVPTTKQSGQIHIVKI